MEGARDQRHVNHEGGDVAHLGQNGLVVRHLVNYLCAVEIAERLRAPGPMIDVGSGTGALSVWAADRLGMELHLIDRDPDVRAVAAAAFPRARVHAAPSSAPPGGLVAAMEVFEHVPPAEQSAFLAALTERVAPGGVLVLSTPDERQYAGGWSGYTPHVGTVSFAQLQALLDATGLPTAVWRLEGAPFEVSPVGRVSQPLVNRLWGAVAARLPRLAGRLAALAAAAPLPRRAPAVPPGAVLATSNPHGRGTGLIGVVHRPP